MKKRSRSILILIVATGLASVVTQLLSIREFLAQFAGNEFIITLIIFNWLVLSGAGTLWAKGISLKKKGISSPELLTIFSFLLSFLPVVQFFFVRFFRDVVFTPYTSQGLYPTFLFSFLAMAPYTLILGFVLPYSLFLLRRSDPGFSGTLVYVADNIGDVSGGILFSFGLILFVTPMQALFLSGSVLAGATLFFSLSHRISRPVTLLFFLFSLTVLVSGLVFEWLSLDRQEGRLVSYKESRYGRVAVYLNQDQVTFYYDGLPVVFKNSEMLAEEIVHFPMSQVKKAGKILVISAQSGIMAELQKYAPEAVYYLEIDPDVSGKMFQYQMIKAIPGLRVIHEDARRWLAESGLSFSAVIMNMPEPDTFQTNRFFTAEFFGEVRDHLEPGGLFSFYIDGYDNYLTDARREKVSSIHRTLSACFDHVMLFPSQNLFFLAGTEPIDPDIPASLRKKNIETRSLGTRFYGDMTPMRRDYLNGLLDREAPINTDLSPRLIRIMFRQWFEKYDTSPYLFAAVLFLLTLYYLRRLSREAYVLFSTGFTMMGSEIVIIFLYQSFYGYIYFKIGIIVTLFLLGLFPGALIGERLSIQRKKTSIAGTDGAILLILGMLVLLIMVFGHQLPEVVLMASCLVLSFFCGLQFPLASTLRNTRNETIAAAFSADLLGAALGTLLVSMIFIPILGIYGAIFALCLIKISSLILIIH